VLGRVLRRIRERLLPVVAAPGSPFDRLDRALEALVDALAEHPATARLLLRGLFEEDEFPSAPGPEAADAERVLEDLLEAIRGVLQAGVEQGVFRAVSVPHTLQTLIGATVYHFASGDFGESLLGRPLLSADAVRRRKEEIRQILHHGLAARTA